MGYIPQRSLENLKKYSYKGVDNSPLAFYVLQPFWTWFVTLWPLSVAPNTMTLAGFSIIVFNFLTLIYYDPTYLTEKEGGAALPHWVYYSWGLGLLAYQTLDGIDGKQAKRTNMAGPLGELFDHGCDSLCATLIVVLGSHALGLGCSWWTIMSEIVALAGFYLLMWEQYHTGQLYLGYFTLPFEVALMISIIFFITGYFGPSFWDRPIWTLTRLDHLSPFNRLPNLLLSESIRLFRAFGLVSNGITSCMNVLRATRHQNPSASLLKPFLHLFPFLFSTLLQVTWLSNPSFNNSYILYSSAFLPFVCAWGLQFAHMMGRIILARVTRQPFPLWDWTWVCSILGVGDAYLPRLVGIPPIIQRTEYNTILFVWLTLLASFIAYARFVTLVIKDITEYLGIACFTVRRRDKNGKWVNVVQSDAKKRKI